MTDEPQAGYLDPKPAYRTTAKVAATITVYALKENRRPIGFAPWPPDAKPKRKPRARL